jgi:ANTAR domain-containing protein
MAKFVESRAVIEQAKGMLMSVYGIGADSAFDLLKWRSQDGNVKLRLVAEQITRDFVALAQRRGATPARSEYDNFLLTVDLRITDAEFVGTAP